MLPDVYCRSLFREPGEIGQLCREALVGDVLARLAAADWLEENTTVKPPFEVGQSYLICTVTLYYVGRVVECDLGWLKLEDASWVHWTGRLSTVLAKQSLTDPALSGRKPRTERCGEVILSLGAVVSAYPWAGSLPKEAIQ